MASWAIIDFLIVALPLSASLFAGSSLLLQSARLKEERRIRTRIKELVFELHPHPLDPRGKALEERLRHYNQLPEKIKPTRRMDVSVDHEMSDVPLAGYQVRNQYVLLYSSFITIALIAFRA